MRLIGPRENSPIRPRHARDWEGARREAPNNRAREQAELTAWRADADRVREGRPPATRIGEALLGLSGSLAAGLSVLAVVLVGVQVWAWTLGAPGPELPAVIGHLVASALALGLQRVAVRRRGVLGGIAALAVIVIVFTALWIWWWA